MKRTIDVYQFRQAFQDYGRQNQFSYDGLGLLFDWFDEYDECCDTETELDVIAICCDFSEEPWEDIADNYEIDLSDCEDEDEKEGAVEEYLCYHTMYVGKTDEGMIYAAF